MIWGGLGLIVLTVFIAIIAQSSYQHKPIPTLKPTKPTPVFESNTLFDFCAKGGYPLPSTQEFDISDRSRKHIVVGLIQSTDSSEYYLDYNFAEIGELAGENGAQYLFGHFNSDSAADIELILCTSFVEKDTSLGECNYYGSDGFKVYAGIWNMTLYIAKTGMVYSSKREIARTYSCPTFLVEPRKGQGIIIASPGLWAFKNWFFNFNK